MSMSINDSFMTLPDERNWFNLFFTAGPTIAMETLLKLPDDLQLTFACWVIFHVPSLIFVGSLDPVILEIDRFGSSFKWQLISDAPVMS